MFCLRVASILKPYIIVFSLHVLIIFIVSKVRILLLINGGPDFRNVSGIVAKINNYPVLSSTGY